MTWLVVDTETTSLPDFKKPHEDERQPRVCQLGAILCDEEGKTRAELNLIIKPDGWVIPPETASIHGITQETALQYGIDFEEALSLFCRLLEMAKVVIAHNIKFDHFMLSRELYLAGLPQLSEYPCIYRCTMETSRNIIKIPPTQRMLACGITEFKSPSLQEAHRHFFGREFDGAHDAMADVRACRDIFFEINRLRQAA